MSTGMPKNRMRGASGSATPSSGDDSSATAERRQARRVRRLKINVVAWVVGTIAITAMWIDNQWGTNGAFKHFGNEGNPGDWNPTLWALGVGAWTLVVGIMALQVRFERPPTTAEIDREVDRLKSNGTPEANDLPRRARSRLERAGWLKFHAVAWLFGMIVLTPIWLLIEWQDNGSFERWSTNSQPGSWDPWILPVGGIWAGVVALFALRVYWERRRVHPPRPG